VIANSFAAATPVAPETNCQTAEGIFVVNAALDTPLINNSTPAADILNSNKNQPFVATHVDKSALSAVVPSEAYKYGT